MYQNKQLSHTDTGYTKKRFGSLRFDEGVMAQDGTWYPVKFSDNPKAESYPDYMGDTDVSPLDPKTREDKDRDDSSRTDMQKMYYGWGTHDTVMRPETDRPITPFASLKFGDVIGLPSPNANKIEDGDKVRMLGSAQEWKKAFRDTEDVRTHDIEDHPVLLNLVVNAVGTVHRAPDPAYWVVDFDIPEVGMLLADWYFTDSDFVILRKAQTASLNFEQPITPELHKPNTIMTHEAVIDALTFVETVKPRAILRHEIRDDYQYQAPVKTADILENIPRTLTEQLAFALQQKFQEKRGQFPRCNRRNRVPADGWSIVGNAMITRAIGIAGLPRADFWSGSLPTPSTQAPSEIVDYADEWLDAKVKKTAEYSNSNDASVQGRQLSIDAALLLLDKWYTTSQQLMSGARDMRNKSALIFENQFNREAVETRLGFTDTTSVEGKDVHEKYQTLKQRLLAIKTGQIPDPLLREVL